MSVALHHLLAGLALWALVSTGLRVASLASPSGLVRVLSAVVIAAALAVVEALALGLVSLGTSTAALVAAALVTRACAAVLVPDSGVPLMREARAAWAALGPVQRLALGLLGGLWLGWAWFVLRSPAIGFDGVQYHLTEIAAWVQNGQPGSIVPISYELPFGNYPLTNEVLLSWSAGIADSWAGVAFWGTTSMALALLALDTGLRELGAAGIVRLAAAAALATLPIAFLQLNSFQTDLPALAWVCATGALALASRRQPRVLPVALLAGTLAIGTKTTAALPVVAILAAAAWSLRGSLRALARPLGWAAVLGIGAGGFWYVRNLVGHGSPLWPFVTAPWGDGSPPFLARFDSSLLSSPHATLDGHWAAYRDALGGTLVILGTAVVAAALAARDRLTLGLGALTVVGALAWAAAPVTGANDLPGFGSVTLSTVRYLLPVVAIALATIGAAGGAHRWLVWPSALALGAAVIWNIDLIGDLGPAHLPPWPTVRNGLAAGAIGAAALSFGPLRWMLMRPLGVVALLIGAALVTAPSAEKLVERHGAFDVSFDAPVVRWMSAQPGYRDIDAPVAFARVTVGPLAGDRFQHRISLIPRRESCDAVRARARRGYVVISDIALDFLGEFTAKRCLSSRAPLYRDYRFTVYGPAGAVARQPR